MLAQAAADLEILPECTQQSQNITGSTPESRFVMTNGNHTFRDLLTTELWKVRRIKNETQLLEIQFSDILRNTLVNNLVNKINDFRALIL